MTTLYIRDNTGAMRYWTIEEDEDGLVMTFGQVGGAEQVCYEAIPYGKGGRDLDEQIASRMSSRINGQIDKGYHSDFELASYSKPTNALGLKKPMLAKPMKSCKNDYLKECFIQYKYDGNRCLVHHGENGLVAYSRNGKIMDNLHHILNDINIPKGVTLDGEIYCHGVPLQTIVSWVKRLQPNTLKLKYIVYDVIKPYSYKKRFLDLKTYDLSDSIEVARTTPYGGSSPLKIDSSDINSLLKSAIRNGYEGLIIRTNKGGYQDGKRPDSLIKVKAFQSMEVTVTGIIASADGWAICVCQHNGHGFRVSAPGDMRQKRHVLMNPEEYIGKPLTIEFANLTKAGKPFHPVAIAWRDYE